MPTLLRDSSGTSRHPDNCIVKMKLQTMREPSMGTSMGARAFLMIDFFIVTASLVAGMLTACAFSPLPLHHLLEIGPVSKHLRHPVFGQLL